MRKHRRKALTKSQITIVAALYIHAGREAEFEQFETAAESIMRRYGGSLERRVGFDSKDDQPHEVHILTFPDEDAFASYRADAELKSLTELRARAIRHTTVWIGKDRGSFARK